MSVRTLFLTKSIYCMLVVCGAASHVSAALINVPSLQTVRVWESTGPFIAYDFAVNGPEMSNRKGLANLVAGNNDFSTSAGESYDVFFSDAQGNLDPNGNYVTVEADYPVVTAQPGGGGLNLGAVDLLGSNGLIARADVLASWYGRGTNYIQGSELLAVDADTPIPSTDTTMGNTALGPAVLRGPLRVTVGFSRIPEPGTAGLLTFCLASCFAGGRRSLFAALS